MIHRPLPLSKQSGAWGIGWIDMRELLKNKELRHELASYGMATVILTILAALWEPAAGLFLLASGGMFLLLALRFARRRYRAMAELSLRIDRVLHGCDNALITEHNEGELSILESEVRKMTIRLKESADLLRVEKAGLSRAMEDIFHQIRTPLTALNIEAALLAEEELPYERRIRLTREVRRQLQRMEWLVEALLKMSRIDAGTVDFSRDTVIVRELVVKAAEPLSIPMELRDQRLELSLEDERYTGDLAWSAEALGNVLKNCMEHTPAGGTVFVNAEETALYTQITIQDNGPGFAKEDIPHLFERFYKGKSAGSESIGIGLALARMIVAEQGGTITADSPAEGGARFIIRFYKSVI